MFYKPFTVLNNSSKENVNEDDMAVDFPFKEIGQRDGSFMKNSSENSQKKSTSDNMEVDDEPSINLSPKSKLRSFHHKL